MVRPKIDWKAINRILDDPSENFDRLARLAALDPSRDFVGMDLRGVDFGWCDLSAYNFDRADLEGADLSKVVGEPRNLASAKNAHRARLPKSSYAPPDGDTDGMFEATEAYAADLTLELAEEATPFGHETRNDLPSPPPGWTWIDGTWLRQHNRRLLSDDELIGFFDGRIPTWRFALSERVPRRAVVSEAEGRLQAGATEPGKPTVVLLQGAGGEGKSTAFYQTIVQLLEKNPDWRVLWRDNDRQQLPTDWVADLPDVGGPVLIATDEADNIGQNLLAFVEMARRANQDRFHFLMAARDTDWRSSKSDDTKWRELSNFQPLLLRGINEVDAEKIYNSWSDAGVLGLGQLGNMTREEAIRHLIATSRDKEVDRVGGAFLAAVLELRCGGSLNDHVRRLLDRLKQQEAPGGSLYDSFAYIAAMHAEDLPFLSSPVLAKELGCTEKDLRRQVMVPLADEACGLIQGGFILTRHRAIAKAAIEIMEEEGEDRWSLITDLAEQAIRLRHLDTVVPELASWRYRVVHELVRNERFDQAVDLIERFLLVDPYDLRGILQLSQTLRRAGEAKKARQVLNEALERVFPDQKSYRARRRFFVEFGIVAGSTNEPELSIWLNGISLSDWNNIPQLDEDTIRITLSSLSVACRELFHKSNEKAFVVAQGAAATLALSLNAIVHKVRHNFQKHQDDAKAAGVEDMSVEQAVRAIEVAVQRAYNLCADRDELVDLGVPYPPDEFGFSSLRDFVLSEQRRTRR